MRFQPPAPQTLPAGPPHDPRPPHDPAEPPHDPRPPRGALRAAAILASFAAVAIGIAAIFAFVILASPQLGFRIVAALLLIDQATVLLFWLATRAALPPLLVAVRIGAVLVIAFGALQIAWITLRTPSMTEIATLVVASTMIAHGALSLRCLARPSPDGTR